MCTVSDCLAWRYARERLLRTRVVALVGLTAGLAAWAGAPGTRAGLALLAAGLVVVLRVLDDLADLAHDTVHHPERALVAARLGENARAALAGLAAAAFAVLLWLHARLLGSAVPAALFVSALGLLYLPWVARGARDVALLLKYPALVVMGAAPLSRALAPALALALALLALEWREKRRAARAALARPKN